MEKISSPKRQVLNFNPKRPISTNSATKFQLTSAFGVLKLNIIRRESMVATTTSATVGDVIMKSDINLLVKYIMEKASERVRVNEQQ